MICIGLDFSVLFVLFLSQLNENVLSVLRYLCWNSEVSEGLVCEVIKEQEVASHLVDEVLISKYLFDFIFIYGTITFDHNLQGVLEH